MVYTRWQTRHILHYRSVNRWIDRLMTSQMSNEQLLDEHGKRLNVHAERLNAHDKVLGDHQKILSEYGLSLFGDAKLNVPGLIESMKQTSEALNDLAEWRDEMVIYYRAARVAVRIALILLGVIGGGVWWPQIQALLKLLGG